MQIPENFLTQFGPVSEGRGFFFAFISNMELYMIHEIEKKGDLCDALETFDMCDICDITSESKN